MILQLGAEEQDSEIWSMRRIQCTIDNLKTEVVMWEGMQNMLWEKRAASGDRAAKQSRALRLTAVMSWILPTTWMKLGMDSSLEFPGNSPVSWHLNSRLLRPSVRNSVKQSLSHWVTREILGYSPVSWHLNSRLLRPSVRNSIKQSLSHWVTREILGYMFFIPKISLTSSYRF